MVFGISIWNNNIFVINDYKPGEEYPMLEIPLPSSGADQFLDQQRFQSIFKQIIEKMHTKDTDGFIMVIPDTYGLQERWILHKNAELTGINLIRLLPLSAALSLGLPVTDYNGSDDQYVLTLQSDEKNGISTVYEISDGVYETCYVHFLRNGHYSKKQLSDLDALPKHGFKLVAMDNGTMVNRMAEMLTSHEVARGKAVPNIVHSTHIDVLRGLTNYCRALSGRSENSILLSPLPTRKLYIESKDILLSLKQEFNLPTIAEKDFILEDSCFSHTKDTHFLLKEKNFVGESHRLAVITLKKEELCTLLEPDLSSKKKKHTYLRIHVKIGFDILGRLDSFTLEVKNEGNGKTAVFKGCANIKTFQVRKTSSVSQDHNFSVSLDSLMDILDNLERAIEAIPDTMEAHARGLKQIKADILSQLEENHIRKTVSLGKPFDVKLHNAIGIEKTGQYPSGTVTKVIHSGYHNTETGAVVRYATVIVEE